MSYELFPWHKTLRPLRHAPSFQLSAPCPLLFARVSVLNSFLHSLSSSIMSSPSITIRTARPEDAEIIADFNARIALETETKQLDKDVLLKGVREILSNSEHGIYFIAEHEGTITVTTKYLPEHQQVQLSVCDDGPTLTSEMTQSLSEPFERTRSMVGTGFDIPLAKLYIEQHDGYLEFENIEPKGNCVHAYLPILTTQPQK